MQDNSTFIPHRIDDIPLLIAIIKQLGFDTLLDSLIPTHGNTKYHCLLSNGAAICIWLVYLISQGDHRKWKMDEWVALHSPILTRLWGAPVVPGDFSDDRLSTLADYLGNAALMADLDRLLCAYTVSLFDLDDHLRLDATNCTGYHTPTAAGLMQFGHRKGAPARCTQFKLMAAATGDGQYLAGQFHAGQRADDPLYLPLLQQLLSLGLPLGMLLIGDSKMGSLEVRRFIAKHQYYYYMPLSHAAIAKAKWMKLVEAAIAGQLPGLAPVWREDTLLGYGYEVTRTIASGGATWVERVQIIRSLSHAEAEQKALARRLDIACQSIRALTPAAKQGVTSYTEAAPLQAQVTEIIERLKLQGLVEVIIRTDSTYKKGKAVRYVVSTVTVNADALREREHGCGWYCVVTSALPERLSLAEGMLLYRQGAGQGIERMNQIYKAHDTLGFDRLYVQKDSQLLGLGYLMTLALRIVMHIEITIRSSLAKEETVLPDYYPNGLTSAKPTTKTMLERIRFRGVTLLETCDSLGHCQRYLTKLPIILLEILRHLKLEPTVYTQLIE